MFGPSKHFPQPNPTLKPPASGSSNIFKHQSLMVVVDSPPIVSSGVTSADGWRWQQFSCYCLEFTIVFANRAWSIRQSMFHQHIPVRLGFKRVAIKWMTYGTNCAATGVNSVDASWGPRVASEGERHCHSLPVDLKIRNDSPAIWSHVWPIGTVMTKCSGYLTYSHGKWSIYRWFTWVYLLKMVIFHGYVK